MPETNVKSISMHRDRHPRHQGQTEPRSDRHLACYSGFSLSLFYLQMLYGTGCFTYAGTILPLVTKRRSRGRQPGLVVGHLPEFTKMPPVASNRPAAGAR